MASQIAHIVYAKKYLENHPMNEMDADLFFLGCVFPDIRRIDRTIKRSATHLRFSPIDLNFSGLSPFEAGWKFHLYSDMKREEILSNLNFYSDSTERTRDFDGSPAKLLEDELIYDDFHNWEKLAGFFNNPPRLTENLPASLESYNLWYAILAKYIEKKPENKAVRIFISKMPSLNPDVNKIIETVEYLKNNKGVIKILSELKDQIV